MPLSNIPLKLTFDDVLLEPNYSEVSLVDIDISVQLTKKIKLAIPILAAAMDTVSETKMAIAMGNLGGMAVLHRSCDQKEQVQMLKNVKKTKVSVGVAVGPHDIDRARALDKMGADIIFTDCAHAHKKNILNSIKKIKKSVKAEVIAGNIATAAAAKYLAPYVDGLKAGVGPGSICTTRIIAGVGVPQLSAISEIARSVKIPIIADGGIKYSGDIVKAFGVGASAVMLGSLLAGTNEAPGQIITINEKKFKSYRGMGSIGVMQKGKSADRYFQEKSKKYVPEGVEALTSYKGKLEEVIFQLVGGLKSGMGYIGAKNIREVFKKARFVQITPAGRAESHPHSLNITREAPNYK